MPLLVGFLPMMFLAVSEPPSEACEPAPATHGWMQQVLDSWVAVQSDLLMVPDTELPGMIFFDGRCSWQVGLPDISLTTPSLHSLTYRGRPVAITASQHSGKIRLPGGGSIDTNPVAFTSVYPRSDRSFFVTAVPEHWRTMFPNDLDVQRFFLGVALHELTHTTQVALLTRRLEALKALNPSLPEHLDDDFIERKFKSDTDYVELFERERALLFDAVAESDDIKAAQLAAEALSILDQRHRSYFTGAREHYAEIEALFLNLEGVAMWVQHEMARRHPKHILDEESIFRTKGESTSWVQGQGLALMLLIERFDPRWRDTMLPPLMESPAEVLSRALALRGMRAVVSSD